MPTELADLSKVVFIGLPASESSNALVIPLAGHEFGHNVWQSKGIKTRFAGRLYRATLDSIKGDDLWIRFKDVFPEVENKDDLEHFAISSTWVDAYNWAQDQAEEIFCDFIGMALFGRSFMSAFRYFLAPGFEGIRPERYPSLPDRAQYHMDACSAYGIDGPEDYLEFFDSGDELVDEKHKLLIDIADSAARAVVTELMSEAFEIVDLAVDVDRSSGPSVAKLVERLSLGVPSDGSDSLGVILNAGWELLESDFASWRSDFGLNEAELHDMLSNLLLKSLEILEIEEHQTRV